MGKQDIKPYEPEYFDHGGVVFKRGEFALDSHSIFALAFNLDNKLRTSDDGEVVESTFTAYYTQLRSAFRNARKRGKELGFIDEE